jgi:hypothetical protein
MEKYKELYEDFLSNLKTSYPCESIENIVKSFEKDNTIIENHIEYVKFKNSITNNSKSYEKIGGSDKLKTYLKVIKKDLLKNGKSAFTFDEFSKIPIFQSWEDFYKCFFKYFTFKEEQLIKLYKKEDSNFIKFLDYLTKNNYIFKKKYINDDKSTRWGYFMNFKRHMDKFGIPVKWVFSEFSTKVNFFGEIDVDYKENRNYFGLLRHSLQFGPYILDFNPSGLIIPRPLFLNEPLCLLSLIGISSYSYSEMKYLLIDKKMLEDFAKDIFMINANKTFTVLKKSERDYYINKNKEIDDNVFVNYFISKHSDIKKWWGDDGTINDYVHGVKKFDFRFKEKVIGNIEDYIEKDRISFYNAFDKALGLAKPMSIKRFKRKSRYLSIGHIGIKNFMEDTLSKTFEGLFEDYLIQVKDKLDWYNKQLPNITVFKNQRELYELIRGFDRSLWIGKNYRTEIKSFSKEMEKLYFLIRPSMTLIGKSIIVTKGASKDLKTYKEWKKFQEHIFSDF